MVPFGKCVFLEIKNFNLILHLCHKIFIMQLFGLQTTLIMLASKKNGRMLSCNLSEVKITFRQSELAKMNHIKLTLVEI
jgi:hypothetical protein